MFRLRRAVMYLPMALCVVAVLVVAVGHVTKSSGPKLVAGANCPPVARNDAVFTKPNQPVAIDVLANDSDVDGDHLQFRVMDVSTGTAETDVANGVERLVYTPSSPDGTTATIHYRVFDPTGDVSTAAVTVAVTNAGALPAGLHSAGPTEPNGDILEPRCAKLATRPRSSTTATATPSAASGDPAANTSAIGGQLGTSASARQAADATGASSSGPDNVVGGDGGGASNGDPVTSTPPSTAKPTTTTRPSSSPCSDGPSCQQWAHDNPPNTNTTMPPDDGGDDGG